ncbi:hypothetical protein JZU61_06540 [bacterium]|nr:hypothetical protein [bacterium]
MNDDNMFNDSMFDNSLTDTTISIDTGPDYMFDPIYSWHPLSIYNNDND